VEGDLVDYDDEQFEGAWESTMQATIAALQTGFRQGGRVVIELAPGSGAVATAVREGQRALAKSAARQWADADVVVECREP
jgi:hypothetical protein